MLARVENSQPMSEILGPKLISLKAFRDDRGVFVERYKRDMMCEMGLPEFVQDNHSVSHPRVLRGLHFQHTPAQGKLVSCLVGRILDVAVDLRWDSPTFGRWQGVELSEDKPEWFWIPAGFAHGFCVLGDKPAHLLYKVTAPWNAVGEGTVHFQDPEIGIQWPFSSPLISQKDHEGPSFADYKKWAVGRAPWW